MTREEQRRRSQNIMRWLTAGCFAGCFILALCASCQPAMACGGKGDKPLVKSAVTAFERPQEGFENDLIQAALLKKAQRIDDCTVTFYSNATCGKQPGDAAYGITASGLPTVEGVTCATDWSVIPKYSDVFIQFPDGEIRQLWATDNGVIGNHVDVYLDSYGDCIQNGRQSLTVWWLKEGN